MRLRIAAAAAVMTAPLLLGADFWQSKDPSQWTDKEIKRLNSNSPWAKDASVNLDMERMGGGPGGGWSGGPPGGIGGPTGGLGGPSGSGMPGGGAPGGGMGRGGPRMGGGSGGMEPPKMTVRWESAAPLREAAARSEAVESAKMVAEWAQEFYVVTVTGLRPMQRRPGGEQPQADPARLQQMQERLRQATALKLKGKDPIAPARIEMILTAAGPVTAFLFPRSAGISADDKEVTLESAMGPLQIRAKFNLRDMMFRGKLEL